MVTHICEKPRQRHLVTYQVEPKEAWRVIVQNHWTTQAT
jgi:hypothetical protein